MRRLPFLLLTFIAVPLGADEGGERIEDKKSGLVVQMPDGWSRESSREKGAVKFAGLYDLTPSRYVLFTVETGPGGGFDEAVWLANEKASATKYLKTTDTPWTTEPIMIGGARAVRYTVGGKANAEKEFDLRIRACGIVRNDTLFRVAEYSYSRAHEEAADALKSIWEAVTFEEANPFAEDEKEEGCGEEAGGSNGGDAAGGGEAEASAPQGEPLVIEDKAGNFKVSLPPGWSLDRAPQEDDTAQLRVSATCSVDGQDVAWIQVFRVSIARPGFFEQNEAGDVVETFLNEEEKFFEQFYEPESAKRIRPTIDARAKLGAADKMCGYELRGLPLSEDAKIDEAKKLIQRGDTSVTVPEFKQLVVRGRLAMLSPCLYFTVTYTRRGLEDNEQIVAALNQIHDSFEFESTEGMPPALESGEGPFGNTLADPKNAAERKETKLHEYKKGAKVAAAMKFDYVLPPGFQIAEHVKDPAGAGISAIGSQWAVQVVAQDANNGWVWIKVLAVSSKSLGSNEKFMEKKQVFEGWVSNFESLARGAGKMPKKPAKIRIGTLEGDGCELGGKINGFTATEVDMVTDEGGWRIEFQMKTRGTGAKTFAKQIETFMKKFKATKK